MGEKLTIVGLGEALWDVLPTRKVLGGAPLNVACHAHRLLSGHGEAIVASRVGVDALGDEVVRELLRRGMTSEYLQRDTSHPTSTVTVELTAGQPTYTFAADIAWDHLEVTDSLAELMATCDAVCFGTLAKRSRKSRVAIWELLDAAASATLLFDVNLRLDFYDDEAVIEGCRRATIVKLNEQELPIIAVLVGLAPGEPVDQLSRLIEAHNLAAAVLTRGERGTLWVTADGVVDPPPVAYPAAANADVVGAGDACAAAVLVGCLLGLPGERIATIANHLGAYVASQPGATPELPRKLVEMFGT